MLENENITVRSAYVVVHRTMVQLFASSLHIKSYQRKHYFDDEPFPGLSASVCLGGRGLPSLFNKCLPITPIAM